MSVLVETTGPMYGTTKEMDGTDCHVFGRQAAGGPTFDSRELEMREINPQEELHDVDAGEVAKEANAKIGKLSEENIAVESELTRLSAEERLSLARARAAAAKTALAQRRSLHRSADPEQPQVVPKDDHGEKIPIQNPRQSSLRSVLEAIALKEKELRELQEREKSTESQLQLYSEVVGLRKELAVVKEDTARTKRQLEATNEIMEKYVPAVERDIHALEEEAQQSSVQHVWTNVCQQRPDETLGDAASWVRVDIEDLPRRVAAAKEKLDAINTTAADLCRLQEEKINTNTDEREKAKARLRESIEEEMANIKQFRSRLKQLDQEQRHHFRRGTHVKQRMFSSQTEEDKLKQRVYDDEAKQFGDVVALEKELNDLTEWVKGARRELEDNQRSYAKEQEEFVAQLQAAEDNGKEVHGFLERLQKENDELKALKHDLQNVRQYVRAFRSEAYD